MKIKRSTLVLWKKRLTFSFFVVIIFSVLYVYFKTSFFTITSYELVGVPDIYKESVISGLKNVASQKRYFILPSNRVLGYASSRSRQVVISALPNTQQVTFLPVGLHTLRITVDSYKPFFRIDDTHGITEDGIVYQEFKDIHELPLFSFATTTKEYPVKDSITAKTIEGVDRVKLGNIASLVTKINSVIFVVSRIDIDTFGDISIYDEQSKSKILFGGDADVDRIWSNLVSAVDTDPLKSQLLNSKDKLEYLDARFGNKVFFKFTNAGKTAIIQSHATTTPATTTLSH